MNLVFIGYSAIGDYLAYIGIIRFLLNYFEKIYFWSKHDNDFLYLKELFNDLLDKIEFVNDISTSNLIKDNYNNENFKIFNMTHDISLYKDISNKNNYYNSQNKITYLLGLENFSEKNPNFLNTNCSSFYYINGFNPDLLTNLFKYNRNHIKEEEYLKNISKKYSLKNNEKYIIISEQVNNKIILNPNYFINKNCKRINICYLVDNPLYLIKLIENAEEIHLFENSSALMIYFLQISNNFNYKNKIYMHFYARFRSQNINDVYKYPILNNWEFIN